MPTVNVSAAGETVSVDYSLTALPPTGAGLVPIQTLSGSNTWNKINSAPQGSQITFPAGVFEFTDFYMTSHRDPKVVTSSGYGMGLYFANRLFGARGAGIDKTILQMVPGSSTRSNEIPPDAPAGTVNFLNSGSNQLHLIRVGNANGPFTMTDLTIRGTAQGHNYNGLQVYMADGSLLQDMKITGNYGTAGANPGETYSMSLYQSHNVTVNRVLIDGNQTSSTEFAAVSSRGSTFQDCYGYNNKTGAPFVLYQCTDTTITRCKGASITGDPWAVPYNFERQSGFLKLDNCTFTRGTGKAHMMLESDNSSCVVTITDPVFDGPKFLCRAGGTYQGNPNRQDVSQIKLYVGGVIRQDLLQILP